MLRVSTWITAVVSVSVSTPALAHSEQGVAIDFWGGFTHPIFGPDHVIAMVAVGLWGAFLGPPAIWLLPVVFPLGAARLGTAYRHRHVFVIDGHHPEWPRAA
jgi:urease accessory protein